MQVSQTTFILYTLIFLLVGGAMGSWLTRLIMRYPFGRNPLTGKDSYVGRKAVVVGKKPGFLRVSINSQVWNAECADMDSVGIGDTVTVTEMENLTLKVEKKALPENAAQINADLKGPSS